MYFNKDYGNVIRGCSWGCVFFESLLPEHLGLLYGGQPEAVGVAIVVARPSAVALNEGSAAELLQAGAWGGQSLTRTLCTCTGVLRRRQIIEEKNIHLKTH